MIIDAAFEHVSDDMAEKIVCGYDNDFCFVIPHDLPRRATPDSAGYDIVSPINIDLDPEEELVIPTFLKCRIPEGWFLAIYPKSGLGWKFYTRIANTVGIVDGDYYNNADNEGHIMVKLRNEGSKPLHIEAGKSFAQAVFQPYGICRDEVRPVRKRAGGFGSTNS